MRLYHISEFASASGHLSSESSTAVAAMADPAT